MKINTFMVALAGAALGLTGCSSVPKAPDCPRDEYVQVNTPDCYVAIDDGVANQPRRTSCPVKTTETRPLGQEVNP